MRIPSTAAVLLSSLVAASALAAPASLTGKWRIVAVNGVDSFDISKTQAEFAANGRFASTIGCNRIAGKPTISGAQLRFGPMAATRMACIPPLDALERQYLSALEAVRGYRLEAGALSLLDANGESLVTLARAK
jgi:heat shock protein HslJ